MAILCEYDTLPEIGHGCGHNLIAEADVAVGRWTTGKVCITVIVL